MSAKVSVDERRRRVAESLQVGNPGNHARELPVQHDPNRECQLDLSVEEIRPYENNPRRAGNAKFDDIKESIRTSGLRSPLTVTRRPGESHFIIEAGGNTRLVALKQLWAETRDPRFRDLVVLFRPWRSESHVLTAHLIENEQRGDMTFWDKAAGIVKLKGQLEAEQGQTLALRPLEDALYGLGLSVNTATLAHYLFAVERLRTLGEAVADLSGLDVKTLQPRLNALKRYSQAHTPLTEDELYAQVFEPVFRQVAEELPRTRRFSVAATCEACEAALAQHVGKPVEVLRDTLRCSTVRVRVGEAPASASETSRTAARDRDPTVSGTVTGFVAGEPTEPLLGCVRAFAESAGIGGCVNASPGAAGGFRLSAPSLEGPSSIERRRAWWLLAGLCGHNAPDEMAPLPLDRAFLAWLADPDDASACAFWALLTNLRDSRRAGAGSGARDNSSTWRGESDAPAP